MAEWDVISQTPVVQDPWSVVSESPASKRVEDAWSVVDQRPLATVANNQGGSSAPPAIAQPAAEEKPGIGASALSVFRKAGEGFADKFGPLALGSWMYQHEPTAEWAGKNPASAAAVSVLGAPIEIPSKLFNAAIGAYKEGGTELAKQLGGDPAGASGRFFRDTAGMAEYAMQQPQHLMRPTPPRPWTEPVKANEPPVAVPGEVTPPRPWTEQPTVPESLRAETPELAKLRERSVEFGKEALEADRAGDFERHDRVAEAADRVDEQIAALEKKGEQPSLARRAAQTAEKIFSPETVDKNAEAAVATIRAATGKAARDTATTDAALEPYRAQINALEPEAKLGFIDYVEGRSQRDGMEPHTRKQVDDYIKEDIFVRKGEPVASETIPGTAFTDGTIRASQNTVDAKGVKYWEKQIKDGARPSILLKPREGGGYSIVDGHTRATAYNRLGVQDVPVLIKGKEVPVKTGIDSTLQPVADALRTAFEERRAKLEALPEGDRMGFIADYFPHMWKNPEAAQTFLSKGTKEGSGRFTKERTIPTVADGIRAGLEPKYTDPLDATIAYVTNADRFIATQEILKQAKMDETIKYFTPGQQPAGWVELKGRLGQSNQAGKAYAPEGWARIYNNYVSRGFYDIDPALGDAMTGARRVSNSVTALELGLSGYHAFTMAQEAMVNQLANTIGNLRQGRVGAALRDAIEIPFAPVSYAHKGKQIQDVYLGKKEGTPEAQQIAQLLEEGGGRAKGMRHAPDYEFSGKGSYYTSFKRGEMTGAGSYWDALKRGQLKAQMMSDLSTKAAEGVKGIGTHQLSAPGIRQIGRVLDTVAQPLFEKYIPLIKNGAFYENMSAWLRQNPDATLPQQQRAARQILDSIDNRFGEMVSDNVFWNKAMKEIAMLSLRSWSWTIGGAFREIGGGIRDTVRGAVKTRDPEQIGPNDKRWTQKMDYVIALPIVYGAMSAVVQGLMAGKPIESGRDLLAPRTGGKDANSGEDERLLLPGYMKDVFGFYEHPVQEMTNKWATAPVKTWEVIKNKDWKDTPIRRPYGMEDYSHKIDPDMKLIEMAPLWLKDYWKYATETFGPITVRNLAKGQKEDSNIPWPLAAMGTRTSARQFMDPEGYEKMMDKVHEKAWTRKQYLERKDRQRYGGTE